MIFDGIKGNYGKRTDCFIFFFFFLLVNQLLASRILNHVWLAAVRIAHITATTTKKHIFLLFFKYMLLLPVYMSEEIHTPIISMSDVLAVLTQACICYSSGFVHKCYVHVRVCVRLECNPPVLLLDC